MATAERYFEGLDTKSEVVWSGREEMRQGDLVFMYRQTPRKAIADLYRVSEDPWFDPYGGWQGFWVPLKKITPLSDITMVAMKRDDILSRWSFVKVSSQGISTAPMPYFAYNRLLELIDEQIREKHNLQPELVAKIASSGQYPTEQDFEDEVIEPLLKHWRFKYERQYTCDFVVGSQHHACQVDFLVKDDGGDVTLFEDKIRIANEKELSKAVQQAKSYALQLGMGSFIVASPEAFWIFKLNRNKETIVGHIISDEIKEKEGEMRSLLLQLRAT